jgi:cytochrome d ubiquinol oxidase subunit I
MRTSEAVTPMKGLAAPFVTFTVVYLVLGAVVAALFVRRVRAAPEGGGPAAAPGAEGAADGT